MIRIIVYYLTKEENERVEMTTTNIKGTFILTSLLRVSEIVLNIFNCLIILTLSKILLLESLKKS